MLSWTRSILVSIFILTLYFFGVVMGGGRGGGTLKVKAVSFTEY